MKKFAILISLILFSAVFNTLFSQVVEVGAAKIDEYTPLLRNKRVALVVNQTSMASSDKHLLDALLEEKINIVKIFAPEHGFRGDADAGAIIVDGKDKKTGLPVISLYGKNYKPTRGQLADVDVVIFDIQDVGTRFFTYISTMHYVMEACTQYNKRLVILDRPNPNDFVDGPILEAQHRSFVGMHAIPILHGLTIGELAQMINGEGWMITKQKCDLRVIKMTGWKHGQAYALPIAPSPNLPNNQSIKLYPSICLFEGTNISLGRGTDTPFQIVGGTSPNYGNFTFTPTSRKGAANPPLKDKLCYGVDLTNFSYGGGLSLIFLLDFYQRSPSKETFFLKNNFLDLLAGTSELRQDIVKGLDEETIRAKWSKGLKDYKTIRAKYLLYPEDRTYLGSAK